MLLLNSPGRSFLNIKGLLLFFLASHFVGVKAQLSGTYSVPGNFSSVASAIYSLNTVGVSGPVTIAVQAGYTETVIAGGFTMSAISGASASNSIVIQRSGSGPNPLMIAYGGGTATSSTNTRDGMWCFIGADHVTIDGIDLMDTNPTGPASMEFGFGFFKPSNNDGNQYNSIINCTITLNRSNVGSTGIYLKNSLSSANNSNASPQNTLATNSFNRFYGNLIQNCALGMSLSGFVLTTNTLYWDNDNDIGGLSSVTGNTIVNYGGGYSGGVVAINGLYQAGLRVGFNAINNNDGGGINNMAEVKGIEITNSYACAATGNSITLHGGGATQDLHAIQLAGTGQFSVTGNVISGTYTTATLGDYYGIRVVGTQLNMNISDNYIGNIVTTSSVNLIWSNAGSLTVSSNTFAAISTNTGITGMFINGSNALNNITGNIFNGITGATGVTAIRAQNNGAPTTNITGNTISNISMPAAGNVYGIYSMQGGGSLLIENNLLSNFTVSPNGSGGMSIDGIYIGAGYPVIRTNTIQLLSGISGTVSSGTVCGIRAAQSSGSVSIERNRIHQLSGGAVVGIASGGNSQFSKHEIVNNLIGALSAPVSTSTNVICGIEITSRVSFVYHNSVFLNASTSSSLSGSSALYALTTSTLELRNNIFVNLSAQSGSGTAVAYRRSDNSLLTYSATSDNNLFYAGTPSASRLIYSDGVNELQTLSDYKALMGLTDNYSISENPPFASTTPTASNFLNISTSVGTGIESGGFAVPGVTVDFAGNSRNPALPDIGAWEGAFIYADGLAPALNGFAFTNSTTCNTAARVVTVSLTDLSGVASGSLSPRVYYRVNNGTYTSVPGVLSTGSATNGVWTFTLLYAVAPHDVVSYFFVAQDVSTTANLWGYPVSGFSGVDVNSVTMIPVTPFSYTVNFTLAGTYSVGFGEYFNTLSAAADAYNKACLTGSVEFALTDPLYSPATGESFPITFLHNPFASANYSLLVRPASPYIPLSVSNATNTNSVFRFFEAQHITIDGMDSSAVGITMINMRSSPSFPSNPSYGALIWIAASSTLGCNHISIRRTTMRDNNPSYFASRYGIVSTDEIMTSFNYGGNNDNITIDCNIFSRCGTGIGAYGHGVDRADNWVIQTNTIGTTPYGMSTTGISARNANYLTVKGNLISNVYSNYLYSVSGMIFTDIDVLAVNGNTVQQIEKDANGGGATGISIGSGVQGFSVTSNIITGISTYATNSSSNPPTGLLISGANTSTASCILANNMISDISSSGTNGLANPIGIQLNNTAALRMEHNSVHLYGSSSGPSHSSGFAAPLRLLGTNPQLAVKNNILRNSYSNTSLSTYSVFALHSTSSTSPSLMTIDHNAYSVGGNAAQQNLVFDNGTLLSTMAAIQATMGGNINSTTLSPVFIAPTDLHIMQTSSLNIPFDNQGTYTGVNNDIDAQIRSQTTPDIGADEFTITLCSGAVAGTISPASYSICSGNTIALFSASASPGVNAMFDWKISTTAGSGHTTVPVNPNTYSYAPVATLTPGTYYYLVESACGGPAFSSNEVTVTVMPAPTASAAISVTSACRGQMVTLTASSNSATSYFWSGPAGFTSTLQAPSFPTTINSIGAYSVTTSLGSCNSSVAAVNFSVKASPGPLSVTPTGTTICLGSSQTFSVNGGLISKTYTIGNSSATNQFYTFPAPYSTYYGGQKMQMLVLSSELSNAGIVAGPINNIRFNVSSFGANWGNSIQHLQDFRVSIGSTTATNMGALFESGLTVVCPAQNYTPSPGYDNVHFFTTPYMWDGTSNLVIETVFSNSLHTSGGNSVMQPLNNTSFQSTIVYAANYLSSSAMALATGSNVYVSNQRPNFILNASGPPSYSWSPASGLTNTLGPVVTSSVTSTTIYTINVNEQGCTSSTTAILAVAQNPTISITASPASVCVGSSATITASGAASYTWNTSSVSNSLVVSPSIMTVYTATGSTANCPPHTKSFTLQIKPTPVISISASSSTICQGKSYTLTASGGSSYLWSTGSTGNSLQISPGSPTVFAVVGTSSLGCTSSDSVSLIPLPVPLLTVTPTNASVCPQNPATLSVSGAYAYSWSQGGTGPIVTVLPLPPSTTYTVVGLNVQGCSNTQTVVVSTYSLPVIYVNPGSPSVCPQGSITLTASGAMNYTWSVGGNNASITVYPLPMAGTYTVAGISTEGCVSQKSVNVGIYTLPVLQVAPSASASVCLNSGSGFTVSGASSYTWNTGMQGPVLTYTATSGGASYTVLGTSSNGCAVSRTVSYTSLALPVVAVTPVIATLCVGESLEATASGAVVYLWMPGAQNTSQVMLSPSSSHVFTVTGTTPENCSASATLTIQVDQCTALKMNGEKTMIRLYPNPGDGIYYLELPKKAHVELYDMTGKMVMKRDLDMGENMLNLQLDSKGVYLLRVSVDDHMVNFRLIHQ